MEKTQSEEKCSEMVANRRNACTYRARSKNSKLHSMEWCARRRLHNAHIYRRRAWARWRQRYQYGSRRERVAKSSEQTGTDIRMRRQKERTRDRQVRSYVSQSASAIRWSVPATADNRGNTSTLSTISFDILPSNGHQLQPIRQIESDKI